MNRAKSRTRSKLGSLFGIVSILLPWMSNNAQAADGTFDGVPVQTQFGPVQVEITITGGRIVSATALQYPNSNLRSSSISTQAIPLLVQQTLSAQSSQISGVGGASYTAYGWYQSLGSAIVKAGFTTPTPPPATNPDPVATTGSNPIQEGVVCSPTNAVGHAPKAVSIPKVDPENSLLQLTLHTNCGDIVINTSDANAPLTKASIAQLASSGFYDNSLCHRLTTKGIYVLQCGDPTATGAGGPSWKIPDENLPTNTKNTYPIGTVAMANSGPNTNGSQFFFSYADNSSAIGPNYPVWGKVTSGLDILKYIASQGVQNGGTDGAPIRVSINSTEMVFGSAQTSAPTQSTPPVDTSTSSQNAAKTLIDATSVMAAIKNIEAKYSAFATYAVNFANKLSVSIGKAGKNPNPEIAKGFVQDLQAQLGQVNESISQLNSSSQPMAELNSLMANMNADFNSESQNPNIAGNVISTYRSVSLFYDNLKQFLTDNLNSLNSVKANILQAIASANSIIAKSKSDSNSKDQALPSNTQNSPSNQDNVPTLLPDESLSDSINVTLLNSKKSRIDIQSQYNSTKLIVIASKKNIRKKLTYKVTTNNEGMVSFATPVNLNGYTVILLNGNIELDRTIGGQ